MHSGGSDRLLHRPGFPIRKSPDQRSFASFPELIAGYHVFRRLSMPRHPPDTLSSLTTFIDHRRVPDLHLMQTSEPAGRAVTDETFYRLTIANGSDRQKGARRSLPDRKTKMGRDRR